MRGEYFLKLMLLRIKVAKNLFIIEIEQENEVHIPRELSQSDLPLSFSYYNAIIQIVNNQISEELRDRLKLKTKYQLDMIKQKSFQHFIFGGFALDKTEKPSL